MDVAQLRQKHHAAASRVANTLVGLTERGDPLDGDAALSHAIDAYVKARAAFYRAIDAGDDF
jgi:hypothetical protein